MSISSRDAETTDGTDDGERFVSWASTAKISIGSMDDNWGRSDFAPLASRMGQAKVVGLSEAFHGAAEPLVFRNRLFRYLVEHQGFTAIAIESGIVEGRVVYDYVRTDGGELESVLQSGLSWAFGRLPQNRALIQWLREHNAKRSRERRVNFYGFDVPGSPGSGDAHRGVSTALTETLHYLSAVDPRASISFRRRLAHLMTRLSFDAARRDNPPGYETLNQSERDELTGGLCDLISLIERNEAAYAARSTVSDYLWGYQAALGARQVDAWLRQVPFEWKPPSETGASLDGERYPFLSVADDVRDRAQADNLDFILRQEGDEGKILVYGHRYHLSASPVQMLSRHPRRQAVLGTYLRSRLGTSLITIGNLVGGGVINDPDEPHPIDPPQQGAIEGMAYDVGAPNYLLDLRSAPAKVAAWLAREHTIGFGRDRMRLSLNRAFDVLLYVNELTPALAFKESREP